MDGWGHSGHKVMIRLFLLSNSGNVGIRIVRSYIHQNDNKGLLFDITTINMIKAF
jgi:hypothetical protein